MRQQPLLFCALLTVILFFFPSVSLPESEAFSRRLIILGFDGADPALTERWMEAGYLPNLSRLKEKGVYCRLGTTLPPQSPVSWASFATGMNPAKTRIFDFLRRSPGSYYPDFAMVEEGSLGLLPKIWQRALAVGLFALLVAGAFRFLFPPSIRRGAFFGLFLLAGVCGFFLFSFLPERLPRPLLRREGTSFWKLTAGHGIPTVVLRAPVTFPPEELPGGRLLSGLGVPDIRKSFGTFSYYATDAPHQEDTEMGGKIIPVEIRDGRIQTYILGPRMETDLHLPLEIDVDPETKSAALRFQHQTETLQEGQWSRFCQFRFDVNPLLHLYGVGRFHLIQTAPAFRLYLSPINFHPAKPPLTFSLSYPRSYSKKLAGQLGLFKTLGWYIDTWALNEGRLEERPFLEDLSFSEEKLKEIVFHELAAKDWKILVGVFEGTDRLQHMFWWTLDPQHPAYDPKLAQDYADVILKWYQWMDRTVGEVMDRFVDDETVLFVLSDHGFHSFRKAVNLNTWLVKNGYMSLKGDSLVRDRNLEDLFGKGEFWPNVDWSKTKAYAIGLAGIYLNLQGREPQGSVSPLDYEEVRTQLLKDLTRLEDPESKEPCLQHVYRREEAYAGPYLKETPDLILGFKEGYRTSWQTALGGIPKEVFEPNARKWSGDHCSYDPSITRGIFFSNTPFRTEGISILDIAPTVLKMFRLPVPSDMDGKPFWQPNQKRGE